MKIILNNSSIQFNKTDYDWEEISGVSSTIFEDGYCINAGNDPTYRGLRLSSSGKCANSIQNGDINVSQYSKIKFPVIYNPTDSTSYGWCLYDTLHLNVNYANPNPVRNNIVNYGKSNDAVKEFDWVTLDIPTTAVALRFTLPSSFDLSTLKVYGVRRT